MDKYQEEKQTEFREMILSCNEEKVRHNKRHLEYKGVG